MIAAVGDVERSVRVCSHAKRFVEPGARGGAVDIAAARSARQRGDRALLRIDQADRVAAGFGDHDASVRADRNGARIHEARTGNRTVGDA